MDVQLPEISDAQMQEGLAASREYAVVLLHAGPAYGGESAPPLIWEHGRRNFALRAAEFLPIVCPVTDASPLCGVGIFATSVDRTRELMADDPAVRAGIFTAEVHPCRGFPGSRLP